MSISFWITIALLVLGALLLASYLKEQFRKSRAAEKNIDYTKIRRWEDDDDEDDRA